MSHASCALPLFRRPREPLTSCALYPSRQAPQDLKRHDRVATWWQCVRPRLLLSTLMNMVVTHALYVCSSMRHHLRPSARGLFCEYSFLRTVARGDHSLLSPLERWLFVLSWPSHTHDRPMYLKQGTAVTLELSLLLQSTPENNCDAARSWNRYCVFLS